MRKVVMIWNKICDILFKLFIVLSFLAVLPILILFLAGVFSRDNNNMLHYGIALVVIIFSNVYSQGGNNQWNSKRNRL